LAKFHGNIFSLSKDIAKTTLFNDIRCLTCFMYFISTYVKPCVCQCSIKNYLLTYLKVFGGYFFDSRRTYRITSTSGWLRRRQFLVELHKKPMDLVDDWLETKTRILRRTDHTQQVRRWTTDSETASDGLHATIL